MIRVDTTLHDHAAEKIDGQLDEIGRAGLRLSGFRRARITHGAYRYNGFCISFLNSGAQSVIRARGDHDFHPAAEKIAFETGSPEEVENLLQPPGAACVIIRNCVEFSLVSRHNLPHGGDQETIPRWEMMGLRTARDACALANLLRAGLRPTFSSDNV